MPSTSRSAGSRRRRRRRKNAPPRPPRRDWSELPLDVISFILGKLHVTDLLAGGAPGVCRSWRRAAREDPSLWRHIDMREFYRAAYRREARPTAVARVAVRFSAGQCDAFWGMYDIDDHFLRFLSEQAPLLKSLRLSQCYNVSNTGFADAIQKFPLLEELELERCRVNWDSVFELLPKSCPQLKHFGHTKERYTVTWGPRWDDNGTDYAEALAISRMHELRSLQLYRVDLTNEGLAAILESCCHLEYLDIRNCRNVNMDDTLKAMCSRIKIKKLRTYRSDEDYEEFEPGSPISYCSTCCMDPTYRSDGDSEVLDSIEVPSDDSDASSYYLSGADEIDLDEHDRMTDKAMRRYL